MREAVTTAILLAAVSVTIFARPGSGQSLPVGDFYDDYYRVLQVSDLIANNTSFAARPLHNFCPTTEKPHPWSGLTECAAWPSNEDLRVGVVSPHADVYVNSVRPYGQNDGVIWQGVGPTASFASGAFFQYRFLTTVLRPRIIYTSNADFELSRLPLARNQSIYAYPYRNGIDWPQRFGDDPWTDLVFDGTYLELAYGLVAAGISNQNMWWGPSRRNSIVMSNNAGPFPHAFIRSNNRIDTPVGGLEGRWIWGSLSHSDYFVDASYDPDRLTRGSEEHDRFITAITLNWNPKWVPGFYVGASQSLVLHYSVEKRFFRDYLGVLNPPFLDYPQPRPKGSDDKLVAFFGRWVHAQSGVEVYGEWARGDHTSSFRDVLIEPDHARAWTLGLQKVFKPSSRIWTRLLLETTNLESPKQSEPRHNRASYFYAHSSIRQGYTQNGQIIGAAIGPGSNSQFLQFDVFAPFGRVGIHFLRWVRDNDRFFIYFLGDVNQSWHEVELGGGVSFLVFWNGFEIGGSATYTKLLNQDYVFENDVPNLNLQFSVRKLLMGLR